MKNFDPRIPFNSLPILPPDKDVETKTLLKKAVSANRALAELKGLTSIIPNPAILINTLGIQEAKDSTEIENIVTTTDKIFQAIASNSKNIDPATKEVMGYREALYNGFKRITKNPILSIELFEEIATTIKNEDIKIRNIEVYIGNKTTTVYTPPNENIQITKLLQNLVDFSNDNIDGVDPLIKMAIMHYQFEAIHPFVDGNGRTGRIINVLYLLAKKLLDFPILYLSKYIIQNKNQYYALLRGVTEKDDWEPWIFYILDGIEKTAYDGIYRIQTIERMIKETIKHIKRYNKNIYSKELVEALYKNPYTKTNFLVESGIVSSRGTASKYLNQLTDDLGILKKITLGRENYYINIELFDLLKRDSIED
ncbi:MAG: Fic family protein [Caldisericia bacterium]